METGTDVDDILQSSERMHRYVTIIGQLPFRKFINESLSGFIDNLLTCKSS